MRKSMIAWMVPAVCFSLAWVACASAQAQTASGRSAAPINPIKWIDAVTTARSDLKLGFTIAGKIASVPVTPGMHVKKGQLLLKLEDEDKLALVEVYRLRAASDLEERAAAAKMDLALVEEARLLELQSKNAAAMFEVQRAQASAILARIELELAQRTSKEIKQQLVQQEMQLRQFHLHAPSDGVIESVIVREGELVDPSKPVLRMVAINPLWVDAPVPTEQTLRLKEGDAAWVRPKLPGYTGAIEGKVIFVAGVADPASDTRIVRVEIPNASLMPAGGHVTVSFAPPTDMAAVEANR